MRLKVKTNTYALKCHIATVRRYRLTIKKTGFPNVLLI